MPVIYPYAETFKKGKCDKLLSVFLGIQFVSSSCDCCCGVRSNYNEGSNLFHKNCCLVISVRFLTIALEFS